MCYCYHVGLWHVLAAITRHPSNERVASVFCRAEVASILSGSLRGVLHCQKIDHARLSSRTSSPRGRRRCRSCSPPSAPTEAIRSQPPAAATLHTPRRRRRWSVSILLIRCRATSTQPIPVRHHGW
ncbi:hypothetical protein PVAP13_7NG038317 [Panicum virgatum]|uniref:Uncharacterized protein n=1 Tax=Panicum virgatum TaxID=38727 RepID=A0A8T0PWH7_PANVG|nr:hypothetical protein PVAP13_7NG038317 [Panicum virgatum]